MSHRGRLGLFLVLGLLITACAWPMDRYGPNRAGYNPFEQTIDAGNVAELVPSYSASIGGYVSTSPVVVNEFVYVSDHDGRFYAFSSIGETGCGGVPKTCLPLWTASVGDALPSTAAVYLDTVFVGGDRLYAFSASGSTNCAGVPKVCEPLWIAGVGGGTASPLVVDGVVYVGSGDQLLAYDANGQQGCSGTPRVCQPLWTALVVPGSHITTPPASAGGVVYVTDQMTLAAFDSGGETNCGGVPRTCQPLWSGTIPCSLGVCRLTGPAVVDGTVFVGSDESDQNGPGGGRLFAFDADGGDDCTDQVEGCRPRWGVWTDTEYGTPSVADGVVYVNGYWYNNENFESGSRLEAWAADGPGCDGCWSWTGTLVSAVRGSTSVANGVVYLVEVAGKLSAYDATGTVGCSGTPVHCQPLWSTELDEYVFSSPTIAHGRVYVAVSGALRVFALPAYA